MNRIERTFNEIKSSGKKAYIPFVTAGDPNIETTAKIIKGMAGNGASIIEIGIPFSDPMAEGPVIQAANLRADGTSLEMIWEMVEKLRAEGFETPLVYLMYYNQILSYGVETFFKNCNESGVDGIIVPDLPIEEKWEIVDEAEKYDVIPISLVAPTSKDRIEKIVKDAKGFVYCVSSLGVTGVRNNFDTNFEDFFAEISKHTSIPKALGFGISTPQQASELKKYCDGIIVGSALVNLIAQTEGDDNKVAAAINFTRKMYKAINE